MLALQIQRYKDGEKHLSAFGMGNLLTELKKDGKHEWLGKAARATLQGACADLASAYDRYFKKISGFPKFKSKKTARPSFAISCAVGRTYFLKETQTVNVQTIGKVKFKTNYSLPYGNKQKLKSPRIFYTPNKKWILTVGIECENQAPELTNNLMGIDLGIKKISRSRLWK